MDNLCNFKYESITIGENYQKYGSLTFYKIGSFIFVTGSFVAHNNIKFDDVIPEWARPRNNIRITGQIQKAYLLQEEFNISALVLNTNLSISFASSTGNEGMRAPLLEPVFYLPG